MKKLSVFLLLALSALSSCDKIADNQTITPSDPAMAPINLDAGQLQQAIYSYKGNNFNLFSCGSAYLCTDPNPLFTSYTTSDYVTAVMTLNETLAGNLNLQDVTNLPGFSLTMMDGHQVMTTLGEVLVSTDANGNIVAPWSFISVCCLYPNNTIATVNWPGVRGISDVGGLTIPNGSYPDTPRDQAMNTGLPGTWTTDLGTPEERIGDLMTSVQTLIGGELKAGQATGLIKPLDNALKSISKGKISSACSQLNDFIVAVRAKTPPLSDATAAALIDEAKSIQASIGC